MTPEGLLC